jgi:hypothetical protein
MSSWCWKSIAIRPVVRPVALLGLIASLTIGSAEAQEFQFPNRPFGLGAVSKAASATGAEIKQTFHRAGLDYDRNAAWPTPFREMDRATYYEWFQPCLDRGWEIELTLSDACFDESGRLNRLGAAKVMQAVRHSPQDRRSVFVWGETPEIAQARIEHVQQHLQTEFGRSANLMVASTQNFPITGRGSYAESVTRAFRENLPPPVLSAQPVAGAVGDEGGGE